MVETKQIPAWSIKVVWESHGLFMGEGTPWLDDPRELLSENPGVLDTNIQNFLVSQLRIGNGIPQSPCIKCLWHNHDTTIDSPVTLPTREVTVLGYLNQPFLCTEAILISCRRCSSGLLLSCTRSNPANSSYKWLKKEACMASFQDGPWRFPLSRVDGIRLHRVAAESSGGPILRYPHGKNRKTHVEFCERREGACQSARHWCCRHAIA